MGLYDKYLNLPKIQFSGYTSSIPKLDYTTNSAEIPVLETFNPDAGRSEAFSNFINNNNFRNLRRAKRRFNELWNADEGYRRLLFDSSLNTNKLIAESQERVNKGGYFDDISKRSAELDAIDYRNAGWVQSPDGTWSQPMLQKPRLVPRLTPQLVSKPVLQTQTILNKLPEPYITSEESKQPWKMKQIETPWNSAKKLQEDIAMGKALTDGFNSNFTYNKNERRWYNNGKKVIPGTKFNLNGEFVLYNTDGTITKLGRY